MNRSYIHARALVKQLSCLESDDPAIVPFIERAKAVVAAEEEEAAQRRALVRDITARTAGFMRKTEEEEEMERERVIRLERRVRRTIFQRFLQWYHGRR